MSSSISVHSPTSSVLCADSRDRVPWRPPMPPKRYGTIDHLSDRGSVPFQGHRRPARLPAHRLPRRRDDAPRRRGGPGALARLQPLDPRQIRHRRVGRDAPRRGCAAVWAWRPFRRCNRAAAAPMVGWFGGVQGASQKSRFPATFLYPLT